MWMHVGIDENINVDAIVKAHVDVDADDVHVDADADANAIANPNRTRVSKKGIVFWSTASPPRPRETMLSCSALSAP